MKILTINPGSTSTKVALFEDLTPVVTKTLRHPAEEISKYSSMTDQYPFRKQIILDFLKEEQIDVCDLDAVAGRGGLVKPIPGGVYRVTQTLIEDLKIGILGEHASNLGGILAKEIASVCKNEKNAFIVDPVVVDELDDIARFSGRPELPRQSIFHALNQKAVARRYSREHNTKYSQLRLIVVHLGGGITIGAHQYGRVIDVNNGLDGEGPFSPERTGTLPSGALAKLCFSGKYQLHHIRKMITGQGGLVAYLGSNNAAEIEERIEKGDTKCKFVYKAMAYQISKDIGAMATVLKGDVDAIILTGGLANSDMLVKWITKSVKFISKVEIYPGEDELQALAENVYFAMKGELPIKEYR